jgi:hypothetical protein
MKSVEAASNLPQQHFLKLYNISLSTLSLRGGSVKLKGITLATLIAPLLLVVSCLLTFVARSFIIYVLAFIVLPSASTTALRILFASLGLDAFACLCLLECGFGNLSSS